MTEPDEARSLLDRFESKMNVSQAKNTDEVLRKWHIWTGKPISPKQQTLLRKYSKELGLEIMPRIYHRGISQKEGVNRNDIKYRYTARRQKTKKGYKMVIQPRKKGKYVKIPESAKGYRKRRKK